MASSIDKNSHNTLAQHESAQTHTPAPAPNKAPAAAKKTAAQEPAQESFSQGRAPSLPKAAVAQPMLGAFAKAGAKPTGAPKPQGGTNSLLEQQSVLLAADNLMSKTSNVSGLVQKAAAAGGAGLSAIGVSLATPLLPITAALGAVAVASGAGFWGRRSTQQTLRKDTHLQGDVDVLKAAVERISKLENPSQVEKVTLNAAQKGLASIKS